MSGRELNGRFKEQVDVSRSLATDRRQKAKNAAKLGRGDRGDHHAK